MMLYRSDVSQRDLNSLDLQDRQHRPPQRHREHWRLQSDVWRASTSLSDEETQQRNHYARNTYKKKRHFQKDDIMELEMY